MTMGPKLLETAAPHVSHLHLFGISSESTATYRPDACHLGLNVLQQALLEREKQDAVW